MYYCRLSMVLTNILTMFSAMMGMSVNERKSTIYLPTVKEEHRELFSSSFPFELKEIEDGLKYLGFSIKPNKYGVADWSWFVSKVERKVNLWCNHWISRGGRLVLIKSVLEVIPYLLASLDLDSKRNPYPDQKICFNYLWKGSLEYKGSHLANWKSLSKPKALGGWGLKDRVMFGQVLASKSLWVFLMQESLWSHILITKYISPLSVVDWIRQRNKHIPNASTQWRALSQEFSVIGKYLSWKVGQWNSCENRINAIVGCGERVFLARRFKTHLTSERLLYFEPGC
jgi:hypothetical protein